MARRRVARPTAEDFAASLPDSIVECRAWGHMFRPYTVDRDTKNHHLIAVLRCRSCGSKKPVTLSDAGNMLRSHINYVKGYFPEEKIELGRARDVFRTESFGREETKADQRARMARAKRKPKVKAEPDPGTDPDAEAEAAKPPRRLRVV
jgi:hypothetical protein